MRIFLFASLGILCSWLLQSCGGGSGGSSEISVTPTTPAVVPTDPPNPLGGIWLSEDNEDHTANFFITEDGRFMTQLLLDERLAGIGTGSGQIEISDNNDINAQFSISGIVMIPGESDPAPTQEDGFSPHQCSTTGTKNGEALYLSVRCLVNGTEFEINPVLRQRLICPSGDDCVNANKTYDIDSSINQIIGDFGVYNFNSQSLAIIEIDPFGIINGRLQFLSWDCGVAGEINPVDARYNLYDITFENIVCATPFESLKHMRWRGLLFVSSGENEAKEIFFLAESQPREGELVRTVSYAFPRL